VLGLLPLVLDPLAALQLETDAVGDESSHDRADEDEHPVDPDLRDVRQPEEHVRPVGAAGEEDEEDERGDRVADRRSQRHVARPLEQVVIAVVTRQAPVEPGPEVEEAEEGDREQSSGA